MFTKTISIAALNSAGNLLMESSSKPRPAQFYNSLPVRKEICMSPAKKELGGVATEALFHTRYDAIMGATSARGLAVP
jgi:hypothetical protein